MYKILFLILVCKNVKADDEEKYIDLLPEEEKQEFLNRIARRILEEIKSNDTPNESHMDITDDQLNAHDAFVQEILKEESDNFKNEKRRSENKEVEENDQVETNNDYKNEHNDGEVESSTDDKEKHIDLTLRDGKREKRTNNDHEFETETPAEISYGVIPVKTVYDQWEGDNINVANEPVLSPLKEIGKLEADQKGNLINKSEEIITNLATEQEGNKNNEESNLDSSSNLILANNALESDTLNKGNKIESSENLKKSVHIKFRLGTTVMIDFEPNSNGNSTTVDYHINDEETTSLPSTVSEEVTDRTTNDEDIWVSTQKIYVDGSEEKGRDQVKETTKVYSAEANKETITISPADIMETNNDENATTTIIKNDTNSDTYKSKVKFVRTKIDSIEHQDIEIETEITTAKSVIETTSERNSLSTIHNTSPSTPEIEVATNTQLIDNDSTVNLHISTSGSPEVVKKLENKDIENLGVTESFNNSNSKDPVDVKYVKPNTERELNSSKIKLDSHKTVLRARLDNLDMSQIDENESIQKLDEDSNKVGVYEVFEVDPKQPNFITNGKTADQNEHPLYVPVYNYAPDNAYFRPYNKFGPNIEDFQTNDTQESNVDESSKLFNLYARNRFSGYSNAKKRGHYDKNVKQSYKKQKPNQYYGFMKPVTQNLLNQEIYYNPNDYADLDYYFGRILKSGKKYKSHNANKNDYKSYYTPNSDEEEQPVSSIHKSDNIKDHIRAVRNILYLQNLFGYVPQASERAIRKANKFFRKDKTPTKSRKPAISIDYYYDRADPNKNKNTDLFRLNKFKFQHNIDKNIVTPKKSRKPAISIDYYYDRADPNKNKNTDLFRLNKSKFPHNINTNIVALTPNPINFELDSENKPEQDLEEEDSKSITQEISDLPFKKFFDSILVVLEDSIKVKNEKLVSYNWLKTTVNIQAALTKLLDLIDQLKYGGFVHPKDIELIKYTIYLFESSKTALQEESTIKDLNRIKDNAKRIKSVIKFPKTNMKYKNKEPIKLWQSFATFLRSEEDETEDKDNNLLSDFENLLESLLFHLNDLHDAIKHIAIITKYKNQNWLQDLNSIYLEKGNKKNLAKLILHLSLSRLLDSIEDSSSQGVEENFRIFLINNRETVNKSKEECLFVLNVLKELRRLNESLS